MVDRLRAAFLAEAAQQLSAVDLVPLEKALDVAMKAHAGQVRESGDPYVTHPIEVARIVLDLLRKRSDSEILAAAILHDVPEETPEIGVEDLGETFGATVQQLVDGVTKISGLPMPSVEEEQSENFRKMLLSMAKDIRVILIKLADRLHNMRTLEYIREPERRERIARETKEIYAPLAHRLGIARFKWELDDLAFKWLDAEAYRSIAAQINMKRQVREKAIEEIRGPLLERLRTEGITADVSGRAKSLSSIHEKMRRLSARFDEIYDLLGIRVIVESRGECYRVLGVIHDMFIPVHDRFKDYIATPKQNMYQSLHTTVMGPTSRMVEIQIRTREMHLTSEIGIAAHYRYKSGSRRDDALETKMTNFVLKRAVDLDTDAAPDNPREFLDILKIALYQDEVFVFTPRGELRQLPRGSTPIDFAYTVHSDVGTHYVGARVNGRIVAMRYELQNGDTVEILTNPAAKPNQDWLSIVRTGRARSKIRQYLKQQRHADSVSLGREMLQRELRKIRKKIPSEGEMEDVAQSFGYIDVAVMLAAIGGGDLSVEQVAHRLYPPESRPHPSVISSAAERLRSLAAPPVRGIRIQGVGNLMIQFARCCEPVPGDPIVGYLTRGRGVSVHRQGCRNILDGRVESDRLMELQWDVEGQQHFLVRLDITGDDRKNLLADVSTAISRTKTNIREGSMLSVEGEAKGHFMVEVRNRRQLNEVIRAVRSVRGVTLVERWSESNPLEPGMGESAP